MSDSYIGNANPPQIYADNVRDDIVPDPNTNKVVFDLSQEVPGGYEGNVTVLRKKFRVNDVIDSTVAISFDGSSDEIRSTNATVSALLSRLQIGEAIIVSGASVPSNNGTFVITNVVYNDPNIAITVAFDISPESAGAAITIKQGVDSPWEVLEPEVDYTILGIVPNYNKQIQLNEVLQEEDSCYVLHRGSATYNSVPSPFSVGPDQLALNLRDFLVDRFTGNGSQTDFVLTRTPVNEKAIVVTVANILKDGDDDTISYVGDFELTAGNTTLSFHLAPVNLAKIKILHLGFSTISRRAALSSGQVSNIPLNSVGGPNIINNAVTEQKLSISPPAVSTATIQSDAVNGSKIKLSNDEALKASKAVNGTQDLIKLDSSDQTVILAGTQALIEISGTTKLRFTATTIEPETTAQISLGVSGSKKFKDLFLSGNADVGGSIAAASANISGNIICGGTVDGVDVSDLLALVTQLQSFFAPGIMTPYGGAAAPAGWLMCDGSVVSQTTYADLYAIVGATYNTGGEGAGNFRLPDTRKRFVLGLATAGFGTASILGGVGGAWDHTHTLAHTHTVSTSFNLPSHTHGIGTLSGSAANHTHGMSHVHNMYHVHNLPPHYHQVNANGTTLTVASASTNIGLSDPGHTHGMRRRPSGTNSSDNFVAIPTNSGNSGNADTLAATTGITLSDPNHGHTISGFVGYGLLGTSGDGYLGSSGPVASFLGAAANNTGTPIGQAVNGVTDASGSLALSLSGNTGDINGTVTVTPTGSTTSQSTPTTSVNNPPYLATNFIIKI